MILCGIPASILKIEDIMSSIILGTRVWKEQFSRYDLKIKSNKEAGSIVLKEDQGA